jgi:hypothetical protein
MGPGLDVVSGGNSLRNSLISVGLRDEKQFSQGVGSGSV